MIKKKSLFDHINQITSVQNPNYWDEISEEDKKSWSNYMTHRFLSMKMEWVELVNEVQKYNSVQSKWVTDTTLKPSRTWRGSSNSDSNAEFKTDSYLIKVKVFCSYLNGEVEEADFFNSLLLEENDDDYFQALYNKLIKNFIISPRIFYS